MKVSIEEIEKAGKAGDSGIVTQGVNYLTEWAEHLKDEELLNKANELKENYLIKKEFSSGNLRRTKVEENSTYEEQIKHAIVPGTKIFELNGQKFAVGQASSKHQSLAKSAAETRLVGFCVKEKLKLNMHQSHHRTKDKGIYTFTVWSVVE